MALVSAHRGGAGDDRARENTLEAFESAIAAGCDFVEVDIRLTADGRPVLFHSDQVLHGDAHRSVARSTYDELAGVPVVDLDAALDLIRGRVGAHLDLKFRGGEVDVVEHVVRILGVDDVIVTTAEDGSVRRLRRWARRHADGLRVGLSSSARSHDGRWFTRWPAVVSASFPRLRLRLSGANLVVAHRTLARVSLAAYARRRGLPLVVWTVDDEAELARWMNDPRVWVVVTNHPARAFAARRG